MRFSKITIPEKKAKAKNAKQKQKALWNDTLPLTVFFYRTPPHSLVFIKHNISYSKEKIIFNYTYFKLRECDLFTNIKEGEFYFIHNLGKNLFKKKWYIQPMKSQFIRIHNFNSYINTNLKGSECSVIYIKVVCD